MSRNVDDNTIQRTDDGSYDFVTSVTEFHGTIIAGSLHASDIITIAKPTTEPAAR